MNTSKEICEKIVELYPDIGVCGHELKVAWSEAAGTWLVTLTKDGHELHHYLETKDADRCVLGKQCIDLGLEIAQMRKNIKGCQY